MDIERLEPSILETVGNGGGGEAAGEETQDITMKGTVSTRWPHLLMDENFNFIIGLRIDHRTNLLMKN